MIVTNLIGGLGNQMFQYAAGLALSIQTGGRLYIAVDMFEKYKLHQGFELQRVFGIENHIADKTILKSLLGWRASPEVRRVLARFQALKFLYGKNFVAENSKEPEIKFLNLTDNSYIHGYWQSERFFNIHADRIRAAFTFPDQFDVKNARVFNNIKSVSSASVHIRRGDYASSKNSSIYHQCQPSYFIDSMTMLEKRVGPLKFFIFSDEPDWALQLLEKQDFDFEIVSHNNGYASFNDLRLMSACNHNIISNSSFSWWAAWLNPSPEKIVIAPRMWMANTSSSRIIPANWQRF